MMSLTWSGRTAAARAAATSAGTRSAACSNPAQSSTWPNSGGWPAGVGGLGLDGDPDDETEFQAGGGGVSRLVMDGKGSPQRGQPVGAQEPARDEEDPGAAAADDVQGLGAGEPGADRHQGGARAERAERGEHPVTGVGRPDRDPVAGGHARGDERPADGGRPVVQLAVAEPGAAGLGQRGRVAEPPRRAGQGGGNGELQPGSSRLGSPRGQNCNVF